ncbi:MAG: hypothetical protein JXB24_06865 [Bacteroidales bacterium]|jgi:hypothetical protein|nr:hypothetical protein [Bacteroidales bacterium]
MEPMKSLVPMAKWLLRIAVALIVYGAFLNTALSFSFSGAGYYFALAMVIFTILLLVGGFLKKSSMTVISGLVILVLSVILMFTGGISLGSIIANFATAAIGFYFMARGNLG